jgi:phosphoribosylformylglycinamidine synthase subunit PurS
MIKATVIVTLKPTVLDPQGMTIHRSLASLGLTDITYVRQGKIFHLQLKDGNRDQVERLAKEVLTNPVIEEYRVIWE